MTNDVLKVRMRGSEHGRRGREREWLKERKNNEEDAVCGGKFPLKQEGWKSLCRMSRAHGLWQAPKIGVGCHATHKPVFVLSQSAAA